MGSKVWEPLWEVILFVMASLGVRRGGWGGAQLVGLSRWTRPGAGCDQVSTGHPPGEVNKDCFVFPSWLLLLENLMWAPYGSEFAKINLPICRMGPATLARIAQGG